MYSLDVPPKGGRKHPDQKFIEVDTSNILFIAGGAFDGIDKTINKRLNLQAIGYNTNKELKKVDSENILQYITPRDIKSFGLIPEIIGRLPVLTYMNPLDRETLSTILTTPKNALIKQYVQLFEMDGIDLTFTQGALSFIVDKVPTIPFAFPTRELGPDGPKRVEKTINVKPGIISHYCYEPNRTDGRYLLERLIAKN